MQSTNQTLERGLHGATKTTISQQQQLLRDSTSHVADDNAARPVRKSEPTFFDVTTSFNGATSALSFGRLVKDDGFSLFEAVSALEIGDAKMDSGYLEAGETFEHDYDVAQPLEPEQLIWLMDELLCLEVAWLCGYPLSQTLFTSSYIDHLLWPEPKTLSEASFTNGTSPVMSLVDAVFRPYCLAVVKCCDHVRTMITSHHFYEEEDFASQMFNRDFLHSIPTEDIQHEIDQATSWIEEATLAVPLKEALSARMRVRVIVLQFLYLNSVEPLESKVSTEEINNVVECLMSTASMSVRVDGAFSLKIQRTLASSVPPRPMIRVELQQAVEYFDAFLTHSIQIGDFAARDTENSLASAYRLFVSQTHQPSVYIRALLQSLLDDHGNILKRTAVRDYVLRDIRYLVLPNSVLLDAINDKGETLSHDNMQASEILRDFSTTVGQSFLNLCRTWCLNRSRIRRTLCHALAEWDQLQGEAEEVDNSLQVLLKETPVAYPEQLSFSYSLSSWVYHYKLLQMEWLISTGFELTIYAPDEMHQMYWYLSNVCITHLSHLDRVSFFVKAANSSRHNYVHHDSYGSQVDKREINSTIQRLFQEFNRLKAVEALADALHRLYLVLQRHNMLLYRPRPYASEQLRYELRMRPFLHLSVPEALRYPDFKAATSVPHQTDLELLRDAGKSALLAKTAWNNLRKGSWRDLDTDHEQLLPDAGPKRPAGLFDEEWGRHNQNALKSCIAVSIAISKVTKKLEGCPVGLTNPLRDLHVEIPKPGDVDRWHDWWVVPRIGG